MKDITNKWTKLLMKLYLDVQFDKNEAIPYSKTFQSSQTSKTIQGAEFLVLFSSRIYAFISQPTPNYSLKTGTNRKNTLP